MNVIVRKTDQLVFSGVSVDRFFKRTLLLDRFLKRALPLSHFRVIVPLIVPSDRIWTARLVLQFV